ncbi:MAG: hypothetical protein JWR01_2956 [Subtercola sp.]|nr:hypothetical protein [Subtercola sp.]
MSANTRTPFTSTRSSCPSSASELSTPDVHGSICHFDDVSVTDVHQGPMRVAAASGASSPDVDHVSVYLLRSGSFVVNHQGRRLCFGEGSAAFSTDTPSAVGESTGQTHAAVIRVPLSRLQPRTSCADFGSIGLAAVHSSPLFDFVEALIDTVAVNAIPAEPTATILSNLVDELLHSEGEVQPGSSQQGRQVHSSARAVTGDRRPMMAMLALQSPAQNELPLKHVARGAGFQTVKELKRALHISYGVTAKHVRSNQARRTVEFAESQLTATSAQNAQRNSAASARKFTYTPQPNAATVTSG